MGKQVWIRQADPAPDVEGLPGRAHQPPLGQVEKRFDLRLHVHGVWLAHEADRVLDGLFVPRPEAVEVAQRPARGVSGRSAILFRNLVPVRLEQVDSR